MFSKKRKLGQPWTNYDPIGIAIQMTIQRHTLLVTEMIRDRAKA